MTLHKSMLMSDPNRLILTIDRRGASGGPSAQGEERPLEPVVGRHVGCHGLVAKRS
jgi:hypothetical protein